MVRMRDDVGGEVRDDAGPVAGGPGPAAAWALFALGFTTFSLLYVTQPLLPLLSAAYGLSPAAASAAVSGATLGLAACLIPFGVLSDRVGRRGVMLVALLLASLLTLACALVGPFWQLVVLRVLAGCALAGVPAVALAYLSEEWGAAAARGVGYTIAGNAIGGLGGRVGAAWLGEVFSWRVALAVMGVLGLLMCLYLHRRLPPSRGFQPGRGGRQLLWRDAVAHLRSPVLRRLYVFAFLLMGVFISVFNYIGYQLLAPPLSLSPLLAGSVFVLFLLGPPTAMLATRQVARFGLPCLMAWGVLLLAIGLLLMLGSGLAWLLAGLVVFTLGYFLVYSMAGAWVTRSVRHARALGSGLYLCAFYSGASMIGSGSGLMWQAGGWGGVVALLLLLVLGLGGIVYSLWRTSADGFSPDRL